MEEIPAIENTDGYKLGHHKQSPKGISKVFSNLTPRSCRHYPEAHEGVIVFGIQYFIKEYLIKSFNNTFFNIPLESAICDFKEMVDDYLGEDNNVGTEHIKALHELGYLPIKVKALPEGTLSPIGIPLLSITNTLPEFFWLTNYLETHLSCTTWLPITSATTARLYKKELIKHAKKTGFYDENLNFLCHDFSMRGMSSLESSITSGMAHLTSFSGSETIPAIRALKKYYNANKDSVIAGTVPATEHSVMCEGGVGTEINTFKSLIKDVYPSGFVSIVSDTWDYWQVICEFLPELKSDILARDGRTVIRPDSGDPVDIICGIKYVNQGSYDQSVKTRRIEGNFFDVLVKKHYPDGSEYSNWERIEYSDAELKGTYEMLWDIFGGTINEAGYKVLNTKIGLLYGDSITLSRQKEIYARLEAKGFAATNLVLGIGSYTYQLKSRDSLGFAVKATGCVIDGKNIELFKDPKTVTGMPKKSLKGLFVVNHDDKGNIIVKDQQETDEGGLLETVFEDGKIIKEYSLSEIRERVCQSL